MPSEEQPQDTFSVGHVDSLVSSTINHLKEIVDMERGQRRSSMSIEKLVAAIITTMVMGVGYWTITSTNDLIKSVVEMKVVIQNQSEQLKSIAQLDMAKEARLSMLEQKLMLLSPLDERVRDNEARLRILETRPTKPIHEPN